MGVSHVVVQHKPPSLPQASAPQTVAGPLIILDWDDTLFPNTHLAKLGFISEDETFEVPEDCIHTLKDLAEEVEKFLCVCLKIGTCYIVTNGQKGWVERSCERFLPNVVPLLEKMTIISAHFNFKHVYPDRPIEWKIAVYRDLLAKHGCMQKILRDPREIFVRQQAHNLLHVIALGDSQLDRCAIKYVARRSPNTQLKSIKLLNDPSMTQLQKQLTLLGGFCAQLSCHNESLDLELSIEMLQ